MKIREILKLMEGWSDEEKALTFSAFSGNFKNSYYSGKPKGHWIGLNFQYIRENIENEIDFAEKGEDYKKLNMLICLMAFSKPKTLNHELLLKMIKEKKLEDRVLSTITYAVDSDISNQARSNYYLTFKNCLEHNYYDLNNEEVKKKLKNYFKRATIENNKKYYSEALCSIASYFYENKESLDKVFVLEMLEYFLVTGKYVKSDVEKVMTMSNWRESQLSLEEDTIEVYSIIKKVNPLKIAQLTNQDKSSVDRSIERLNTYLNKKLYTQEQYVSLSLIDKAADKIFIISFENKTKEIITASEFISYFINNDIKQDKYDEIWNKIELKNKINESLPEKKVSGLKVKI